MAGDKSNSTSCYMHSDTATGKDSLGFKPYVEAIAEFLAAEGTLAPITLSIEGQWGCGKSSFMKQLKEEIEKGNICDISIREFLKYLLLNKKKAGLPELKSLISKLEILFSSIEEKFSQNNGNEPNNQDENFDPYSFENKMRSILIYIPSKIKRRKYFTVWFNCWRYEKEDELWAAFALNFMEQLSEQLSWGWRLWAQFKLRLLRLEFKWKSKKSVFAHVFLFILAVWFFIDHSIPKFIDFLSSYSSDRSSGSVMVTLTKIIAPILPILYIGKDIIDVVGNPFNFSKFVSNPNYKEHISFIEHFHSDFYKIVESYAGNSRVYVFVDDLDRCEVPKAAELMQALNLMISDKANVYFSIGIDRKVISAGLAAKNEKVLKYLGVDGLEYGYDYIEKFIQLPFKVPSSKNEDFKTFMNPLNEKESSSKAFWLSNNPLSKKLTKLFSKFKVTRSSSQPDKESISPESTGSDKPEEEVPEDAAKEESKKETKIKNDQDCDQKSGEWNHILEMIAPALDRNPRRMKQFFNLFRFQRTIGYGTDLFSYDLGTDPKIMWNCRKLAKFVAISMKWPSLVSALGSNSKLLDQLQEYVLKAGNENTEDKNLEKWVKDERLISLLRYGCEGNDPLIKPANYTLSGLDFSKLLQISPVVAYPDENFSSSLPEMEFVRILAGEFLMGSHDGEEGRWNDEGPAHKVTIKNPFYLGKYPVTQNQWKKVMGSNPSSFKGDDRPVEKVSWSDVQEFIKRLNEMESGHKYRLPSEAEWEYACRAGTTTRYSFGDDESKLDDYAWYDKKSGGETHPVGEKRSNPWGLYDMHGNVWEWVQDRYHDTYEGAPSDGSAWEDGNSSLCVGRGGGWSRDARDCRSAGRGRNDPGYRSGSLGFRLLRIL